MYHLVRFVGSPETVDVAFKWLTPEKSAVYWPPIKGAKALEKLLHSSESAAVHWKTYNINKIYYSTDDIEKAKVEETSDLQTDEEEPKCKIKKLHRYISSSSSDESEDPSFIRPPALKKSFADITLKPSQPSLARGSNPNAKSGTDIEKSPKSTNPKSKSKTISVFHEKLPTEIPWKLVGVQYVVEASGMFTNFERASGHLKSETVKRVVVTAPSIDIPMIILGVNHHKLGTVQKVLSCGSSTLYCLAPIVKVLEDSFGVEEGFITSIHAMTPSLKPLDGLCLRGKHWRDHRSIHQNIIPASTGACKALGRIIPSVRDKMTGLAFRVPIVNVSVLDISVRLVKPTSMQDILHSIRNASKGSLRNILKISTEEAVSSDFNRDSHSCIVDGELSMGLNPNSYKIICWYENEYSYACRVLDSIFLSEKQLSQEAFLSSLTCTRPTSPMVLNHLQQTDNLKRSLKLQDKVTATDLRNPPVEFANVARVPSQQARSSRSLLLRGTSPVRTTSPTNTPARKDSKTLKLKKDESGQTVLPRRENKSSFFQHFCSKTPKECVQPDSAKAQERLEKVKVEFSKMVNITEDLLKKSCRQNSEATVSTVTNDNQDRKSESEDAVKSSPNDTHSTQDNNSLQADKVDVIKGVNKLNLSNTNSTVDSLINDENRCSNYDFNQLHKSPSNRHIATAEDNKNSYEKTHRLNKLDAIVESSNVGNYRQYDSTDNTDTTREYLSDKSQLRSLIGNENYIRAILRKAKNYPPASRNAENPIPPILENQTIDDGSIKTKLSNKELSKISINFFKNKSSLHAIEKELRKRNIVLISDEEYKSKTKENVSMNKVHRNPGVYCCQKSAYGYGDSNKLYPSSAHESLHKANSKYSSSLLSKCKTDNIISERDFHSNELEINIKSEELDDDKPGDDNHAEETKFEVKIDQKDSDYETDNFSVKTDPQKEKHFEIYTSRSNVFSSNTEDDNKENKCLNDNLLHSAENDKTILLREDSKSDFDNYEHSESRMRENLNREEPERNRELHEEDKDTMNGQITSLEYEGYMSHAEDRPGSPLRAEESHPSVYSNTSNPPSPYSTNKQDIFDKLDSVSATDSDCSDRIDGKKSQVIHITDLTKSLEDLERLDKICRIVEISDELSDKLFSRLDSGDSHTSTGKKWSFKDLCEKINLDEFCNKVFGQVEN